MRFADVVKLFDNGRRQSFMERWFTPHYLKTSIAGAQKHANERKEILTKHTSERYLDGSLADGHSHVLGDITGQIG